MLMEKLSEQRRSQAVFLKICREMDKDKNGTISLVELLDAYDQNDKLQEELTLMHIEKDELEAIYVTVDKHGDQELPYSDFISNLYRTKTRDIRSLVIILHHMIVKINTTVNDQLQATNDSLALNTEVFNRSNFAWTTRRQVSKRLYLITQGRISSSPRR